MAGRDGRRCMRNPAFAMLALLSPVLVLGTTVEQKRRRKKDIQDNDSTFAKAFDEFKDELAQAADVERARRRGARTRPRPRTLRRAALPDDDAVAAAQGGERLPHPARRHRQRGLGAAASTRPPSSAPATTSRRSVDGRPCSRPRPVDVELTDAGVVGIVGERADALAVARSLLCQAVDPLRSRRPHRRGLLRPRPRGGVDLDRLAPPRAPAR